MTRLRLYQAEIKAAIYEAWGQLDPNGVVLAVSPARSGKTVLFSDIIKENAPAGSVAIAHRARLVEQMSFALAKAGVRHRIIGPESLQRACSARHMAKLRRNFVDPSAWVAVASVNTLAKRKHEAWFDNVTLWVTDEAHHLTKDSMWDKAIKLFTRARGLMVTATPCRADGKGLGRASDGVADVIVVGRSPRELINMGYLTDYRLVLAAEHVDVEKVKVGASGDFVHEQLAAAVHASKMMVGDVVAEYLRHGGGKPGITFAVDVEEAKKLVAEYRARGVPAELVTADTPDALRLSIMAEYEAGRLLQLVNVDLFGEGVDLPDVHVVSMARHTNSYGLFIQQFWRGGTLLLTDEQHRIWSDLTDEQRRAQIAASAKPKFLVIDHVGNVMRHARTRGLPCMPQKWSLEPRERSGSGGGQADDVVPLRACSNPDPSALMMLPSSPHTFRQFRGAGWGLDQVEAAGHAVRTGIACGQPYERTEPCCPHCGFTPVPAVRSGPEHVDGNLLELDPAVLANMRGEVLVSDAPPEYNRFMGDIINRAHQNRHAEKMESQGHLRRALQLFCGYQMDHLGRDEAEMYKRFYFAFGIDALSAQALGTKDAEALRARVAAWLERHGVIEA
jgi:superfamily II DNA or RNA helicase